VWQSDQSAAGRGHHRSWALGLTILDLTHEDKAGERMKKDRCA
jgi:hypothetical protein